MKIAGNYINFKQRTYDNTDPKTQLYRGIRNMKEVEDLLNGKTLEGTYYATSSPKGYRSRTWSDGGRYGNIFIAFNKDKITFWDHRDYDADTRYFVEAFNLADIKSIRKGFNEHGELLYSMDFEEGKKRDIENKLQDIRSTITKLKKIKLSKEEKKECIDILKSYKEEFPYLNKIINIVNIPYGRFFFVLKEALLIPKETTASELPIIEQIKSITKEKVKEIDDKRNLEKFYKKIKLNAIYSKDEGKLQDIKNNLKMKFANLNKIKNPTKIENFELQLIKDLLHKI